MPDADRIRTSIPRHYRQLLQRLSDESSPSDSVISTLISAIRDDIKARGDIVLKAINHFGMLFSQVQHVPLFFSGEASERVFDGIHKILSVLSSDGDIDKNTLGLLERAAYRTFELSLGHTRMGSEQVFARSFAVEVYRAGVEGNLHLALKPEVAANHLRQIKEQVIDYAERLGDQLTRIEHVKELRLPRNTRAKLTPGLHDALPLGDGV